MGKISLSGGHVCRCRLKLVKPIAREWHHTRFDRAPALMTLRREAGSPRRSVGDRDRVPATIGRLVAFAVFEGEHRCPVSKAQPFAFAPCPEVMSPATT